MATRATPVTSIDSEFDSKVFSYLENCPSHSRMPRYQNLLDALRIQLQRIEPSQCQDLKYYPCLVTLQDGQTLDRVYIVAEAPYIRMWGVYPEDDRGKKWIRIEDVASIAESPTRLPARFANRLYEAGESGMGYTIFTVRFFDGTKQACATGNAVDFIHYPENKGPRDVVSVKPHVGRDRNPAPGPAYFWCIYSGGELPAHIYSAQVSKGTLLTLVRRFLRHVWRRR